MAPPQRSGLLGVRGGLSVDHLVAVGAGGWFDQLGGPGLYAALGGRLVAGTAVRLATALPEDDDRFGALFEDLGIDTTWSSSVPTVPRVWILNSPEGRRIVATAPPSAVELELGEQPLEAEPALPDADGFGEGLQALLDSSPLARSRAGASTVTGVDPHQLALHSEGLRYLRRVTPANGILLPSRVQLGLIDGDARAAARRLASELQVPVVARLDREGMYLVTAEGTWTMHDEAVRVRETTGAGDSSAAAILAALAGGADLPTAVRFGISVARIALSAPGPTALLGSAPLTSPFPDIRTNQDS
ncbi:carbohydrate kinase family protein [Rathayibacter caricis]|uniref:carbohydrate kinase family protein n=1 Tax=Rathayibacter caricis TaxID=110936 RepID=UPI001FB1C1CD|nr:carbohydrate kinase family protein [Rathayibacter caricis]MCJ1697353.1 carbohydrate kinase family protein [Rathayibacter caricis]